MASYRIDDTQRAFSTSLQEMRSYADPWTCAEDKNKGCNRFSVTGKRTKNCKLEKAWKHWKKIRSCIHPTSLVESPVEVRESIVTVWFFSLYISKIACSDTCYLCGGFVRTSGSSKLGCSFNVLQWGVSVALISPHRDWASACPCSLVVFFTLEFECFFQPLNAHDDVRGQLCH